MNRRFFAWVLLAALVLGGMVMLVRTLAPQGGDRSAGTPLTSMRMGSDALIVRDQAPSAEVHVAFAALGEAGFVVVLEDEQGLGRVVGVSRFLPAGEFKDFPVALDSSAEIGWHYAMLRSDDGDERFDAENDPPVRDAQGSAVMVRFLISEDVK